MIIANEKVVSIHYTLKNAADEVLDSSEGHDTLTYIHGIGNIIPGLEKALAGKSAGDKLAAVIPPEQAYGVRNEDMVQEVSMSNFQDPDQVQLGVQFQVHTPKEQVFMATITKIVGDVVTIDMNHPLADETLYFDIQVMDIRDATAEEKAHGHVHAPGAHAH